MMQEQDYLDLLNRRIYDPKHPPEPEQVLLSIQCKNIGSLGNYIILSGLPKAGKSTYINAIIAAAINGKCVFGFSFSQAILSVRQTIGYFDTESNRNDFYNNMNRIKHMAGIDIPDRLNAFSTRVDSSEHIMGMIDVFIRKQKPAAVIIDGMLDLITNYNDEVESRKVIEWLKRITTECETLIIGVVHVGKKDGHTLGHFGSMLDRYAQSVMEIEKDKVTQALILRPKFLRSAQDFDAIAITYGLNGYEAIPNWIDPKK